MNGSQRKIAVSIYGLLCRDLVADVIEERDEYKDGPIVSSFFCEAVTVSADMGSVGIVGTEFI